MSAPLPPTPIDLTQQGTYAVVFTTLAVFALSALAYLKFGTLDITQRDTYFAARNSQSWPSVMFNFFSATIGCWTFIVVPQLGTYAGSLGIIGYALATVSPLVVLDLVAPYMRRNLPFGVTLNDFVQQRFGPVMQAVLTVCTLFNMFIFLTAEFTSIGGLIETLTGVPPLGPVLGVSLVTLTYSTIGGLPVSLMTDNVQGVATIVLVFAVCVGIYASIPLPPNAVLDSGVADATGGGAIVFVVLVISLTASNMFHAGFWQRVWSAGSDRNMRIGVFGANVLQTVVMLMVGALGFIAVARYGENLFAPDYVAYNSMLLLLNEMSLGWRVTTIVCATCMICSTADALQNGLAALFSSSRYVSIPAAQLITVVLNVPAIVLATLQLSVLSLFIISNLLTVAVCMPIAMGMWTGTNPKVALVGVAVGLATVILIFVSYGSLALNDVGTGLSLIFYSYDLRSPVLLAAFILAPTLAALVTYAGSKLFPYEFPGFALKQPGEPLDGAPPSKI